MAVSNSTGPRITHSDISDARLCEIVGEVLQVMPNAVETYVIGSLRSRGVCVQRWCIWEATFTVDPGGCALKRYQAVVRQTYNVPS